MRIIVIARSLRPVRRLADEAIHILNIRDSFASLGMTKFKKYSNVGKLEIRKKKKRKKGTLKAPSFIDYYAEVFYNKLSI